MVFRGFKGSRVQGVEWKEEKYGLTCQIRTAADKQAAGVAIAACAVPIYKTQGA